MQTDLIILLELVHEYLTALPTLYFIAGEWQLISTQILSLYCSYFAVLTTAIRYNYTLLQLHKIRKLLI